MALGPWDLCDRAPATGTSTELSSSRCPAPRPASAQPKRTPQRAAHPNATFLFRDTRELEIPRELENRIKPGQPAGPAPHNPLGEREDAGKGRFEGSNDVTVILYTKLAQISLFHQGFSFGSHSLLTWGGRPSAKRNTASVTLGHSAGKAEALIQEKPRSSTELPHLSHILPDNPKGGSLLWTTLNKAGYRQAREAEGSSHHCKLLQSQNRKSHPTLLCKEVLCIPFEGCSSLFLQPGDLQSSSQPCSSELLSHLRASFSRHKNRRRWLGDPAHSILCSSTTSSLVGSLLPLVWVTSD